MLLRANWFETALASLLMAVIAGTCRPMPEARADDPALDRAVVEAQLKERRAKFQILEDAVAALRNEVKTQMIDIVAGQQLVVARTRKEQKVAEEALAKSRYQLMEYQEGIFLQDKATVLGEIKLAGQFLEESIDRLEELRDQARKGIVASSTLIAAQLTRQQAQFDHEQAQMQLAILEKYTKEKETKIRQTAIEVAEAILAEKRATLEAEQAKEKRFREMTAALQVRSTEDAVIALIDDAVKNEGKAVALVTEAQKLEAQIHDKPDDAGLMQQLTAKKNEAIDLMNRARTQLLEAVNLGNESKSERQQLRDAEQQLKRERQIIESLENRLLPAR